MGFVSAIVPILSFPQMQQQHSSEAMSEAGMAATSWHVGEASLGHEVHPGSECDRQLENLDSIIHIVMHFQLHVQQAPTLRANIFKHSIKRGPHRRKETD